MKKFFEFEESVQLPNKYIISPNHKLLEKFFKAPITGSYNVLPARIIGLSYANYLRYCRDILHAQLIGKNGLYVVACFTKTQEAQMFLRLLNKRMEFIEKEFDDPVEYIKDGDTIKAVPFEEIELPWRED